MDIEVAKRHAETDGWSTFIAKGASALELAQARWSDFRRVYPECSPSMEMAWTRAYRAQVKELCR